jgi:hypothetical protein
MENDKCSKGHTENMKLTRRKIHVQRGMRKLIRRGEKVQ